MFIKGNTASKYVAYLLNGEVDLSGSVTITKKIGCV